MVAQDVWVGKHEEIGGLESVVSQVNALHGYVAEAAREGVEAHVVERRLFEGVLALGHVLFGEFLRMQGDGDLGAAVELPDGRVVRRLDDPHLRRYVTIFGEFAISRRAYGTREGQAIAFVPLDARLNLPEGETSYLLQDWDQELGVQDAWRHVSRWFRKTFAVTVSVDTLERTNRKMAADVAAFRDEQPAPEPEDEGEILVATADHKGVPMRRPAEERPTGARRRKGEKANKKRMACLGSVYSVDPKPRTPEDVVASLFREAPPRPPRDVPEAVGKRVAASLSHEDDDGREVPGREVVFAWMAAEVARRRRPGQTLVRLMDGERSLAAEADARLPADERTVDVLDLIHPLERLWTIAYLFHAEGSPQAEAFVRPRLLAILEGRANRVIGGLRQAATKRGLSAAKRNQLESHCRFLKRNLHRMRYDEYLAAGLPIASGVIEGACRHVVRDRMERAGMRWTEDGAQAMLDLRTTWINGQWEQYQADRIARERERLHPHRRLVQTVNWPLAARGNENGRNWRVKNESP